MSLRKQTDWVLFFTVVLMVCFGLVMIFSASNFMAESRFHNAWRFVLRQLGWAVVSFIVLMYFKRKYYSDLSNPAWGFLPLGVILSLLLVVYFVDRDAHRWLRVGPVGLQPSEFAKPALVVFLAWFVTKRGKLINTRGTLGPAALALGVLAISVVAADLGTAAVLLVTAGCMFYMAGLDKRYFLVAVGVALLMAPVAVLSKPYRVHRIIQFVDADYQYLVYVDPDKKLLKWAEQSVKTRDAGYQIRQSKIAVGAGGAMGTGLMQGKQKLLFLPEAHNDFIFAVIGEELGLWGALAVILGYMVIFWRGLRLYWLLNDDFARYLALGITVAIVSQALMNMSVVVGLAPTKGFPLPMISYGGSSLLSTLTSLGILMSVSENA